MGMEIERKFLVCSEEWRGKGKGIPYRQGYLYADRQRSVRVRLAGNRGFLTVKGRVDGRSGCVSRLEYEYEIPVQEARQLLESLCPPPLIEKTRYRIEVQGSVWEVDEFSGVNQGLVVAEIELSREDEDFARPSWLGPEVSDDPRYLNANLARNPWSQWPENRT